MVIDSETWRFLPPIDVAGAMQMAIDRWLLEQGQPCLRFYQWQPAAISLGYHQRRYPPEWKNLGLPLVRRPSGGRAVLHQGDLTYAIVIPPREGSRQEIYDYLCGFLIAGWKTLGVQLNYGQSRQGYLKNPSCFNTATSADLVTKEGYKLIGSAQLKTKQGYLQHGSMVLKPDRDLFTQVFHQPYPYAPSGYKIEVGKLIDCLVTAASNYFKVSLRSEPLQPWEWEEIKLLRPLYHISC